MKTLPQIFTLLAALSTFSTSACDTIQQLPGQIEHTTSILNDAIKRLTEQSGAWQQVLKETVDKLTEAGEKLVRDDVQRVLDRAVAAAGIEARCSAPFIASRVLEDLKALVSAADGADGGAPLAAVPAVCSADPNPILLKDRPTDLSIDGYNFDATDIRVLLRGADGDRDITAALSRPSHFQLIINLTAVPFTRASREIVLVWGSKDQATFPVIQKEILPCPVSVRSGSLTNVTIRPRLVHGDAEYGTNKIQVFATASMVVEDTSVWALVSMDAQEQGKDTRAFGTTYERVYTAPPGTRIRSLGIATETTTCDFISDGRDGWVEHPPQCANGPASDWAFQLNHQGDDAGIYTNALVKFNDIRPELEEDGSDGHCINQTPRRTVRLTAQRTAYDPLSQIPILSATPAFAFTQQVGLSYSFLPDGTAAAVPSASTIAVGAFTQGTSVTLKAQCPIPGGVLKWVSGPCQGSGAAECRVIVGTTPRQDYAAVCQ